MNQPKTSRLARGGNVADHHKVLLTKIQALIAKQIGRDSTGAECKVMSEAIAPKCRTSIGHIGEVPESLAKNTDATWISNMIGFVDDQIANVDTSASPMSAEITVCPLAESNTSLPLNR